MRNSYIENTFPVRQGKVNLTSGNIGGVVVCVVDGSLDLVWEDDSTDTISMSAGDAVNLFEVKACTIVSGTFHQA